MVRVESAAKDGEDYILVSAEQHAALRAAHLISEAGYYWNRPGVVRRQGRVIEAQPALAHLTCAPRACR
jgi:hypothetical protein